MGPRRGRGSHVSSWDATTTRCSVCGSGSRPRSRRARRGGGRDWWGGGVCIGGLGLGLVKREKNWEEEKVG